MEQPTFQTQTIESADNYGQIVIEPLEQGFGATLGNSLRRVLLEHIPGAAATTIQITGVNHQFTTLDGMKEDIVDLILNVKQLRFSYRGEEPVKVSLKAQGPGEVTGSQLDLPSEVKLANPDLHLATLNDKKDKLEFTITVESGKGYSPAEEKTINTLGVIPIDATFSPITKVNYKVSDTRVGRYTNFDKLTMEIWTDATITPEDALTNAAGILQSHFQQIVNPISPTETQPKAKPSEPESYKITVEELELPTRIANALRKSGLGTVKDLVKTDKSDIAKIKNLGSKSVDIIAKALKAKGVEFEEE